MDRQRGTFLERKIKSGLLFEGGTAGKSVADCIEKVWMGDWKMLKLPHKYTGDKKADALIASYLNRNILELVRNEILNYETGRRKEA